MQRKVSQISREIFLMAHWPQEKLLDIKDLLVEIATWPKIKEKKFGIY